MAVICNRRGASLPSISLQNDAPGRILCRQAAYLTVDFPFRVVPSGQLIARHLDRDFCNLGLNALVCGTIDKCLGIRHSDWAVHLIAVIGLADHWHCSHFVELSVVSRYGKVAGRD